MRLSLAPALAAAVLTSSLATSADADVLASLVTDRDWIGYSPRNQNPNAGIQASQASMRNDLEQLYDAGWRNLYHYSLSGTGQHIPRIAKEVGFENVLAGVFYFNEAQLAEEKANALVQDQYIDGYLVGNEGLFFGRYSGADLVDAIDFFDDFGKPVSTTEVGAAYFNVGGLAQLGDFVSVNIQPWFNPALNPFDPVGMAQAVRNEYVAIQALVPDKLVVIKEAWWPTDAHPAATEANQIAFFGALSTMTDANGDPILFQWGESHDQPWKTGEISPFGSLGPDWGFYESNGSPKAIVNSLSSIYTAEYPINFLQGDYDRDGDVDSDDVAEWVAAYGTTVNIAGSGADGNFDRVIDAADFVYLRENATASVAVPEPSAALLAALALLAATRRR